MKTLGNHGLSDLRVGLSLLFLWFWFSVPNRVSEVPGGHGDPWRVELCDKHQSQTHHLLHQSASQRIFLPASCELGSFAALEIKNEQDGLCISSSVIGEIKSKGIALVYGEQ